MPLDLAFDHVENILGDVGGVVRQAFEIARDAEEQHDGIEVLEVGADDLFELVDEFCVKQVDLVVGDQDLPRHHGILADQRVQRLLDDGPRAVGHHGDVDRHRHWVLVEQLEGALGDIGGEVADSLQFAVDLDHGSNEAQVTGHRLVEREELEALLLDVDLVLVDQDVGGNHAPSLRRVALIDGLEGKAEVLLHECPETKDFAFETVQSHVADAASHPTRARLQVSRRQGRRHAAAVQQAKVPHRC